MEVDYTKYFTPKTGTPGADERFQAFSVKSIDTEKRQITAVASSEIIDRDGEIVTIAALKAAIKDYMRNPVILPSHAKRLDDGRSPVIGSVIAYAFKGKEFIITVQFADTELGLEYWKLYRDKHQRAFSIGFRIFNYHRETRDSKSVTVITEIELLEISACAIPANPNALSKSKSFVQQKKIEAEKQKILNDDEAFYKLLDHFEKLGDEYGDPFGNIPADSDLWEKFTPAETAVLKDFAKEVEDAAGSDDFSICDLKDCCGGAFEDESDGLGGQDVKALESNTAALSLAEAIQKREKVFIEAFGSETLYRKYKLFLETKASGLNPSMNAGPDRRYTHEELKLFELITEKGLSVATESVAVESSLELETKSFAELVGGRR